MKTKNSLFATKILGIILLAVAVSSPALAAPISYDGNVQASEDYAYSYGLYFDFDSNKGSFHGGGGQLFLDIDGNNLSLGFVLPTTIVDNVYGDESIGRYDWPGEHKFKHLTGSDKVEFGIDGIGGYKIEYGSGTGYDAKVKEGTVAEAHSSLGYNHDMFGSLHSDKFGDGSTSPFTSSADNYTVEEDGLGGWLFQVMYELKITDTDLGVSDIDSLSDVQSWLTDIEFHISPSKHGTGGFTTTVTPVPAAVWMFGSGLIGLAAFRKKSKKA